MEYFLYFFAEDLEFIGTFCNSLHIVIMMNSQKTVLRCNMKSDFLTNLVDEVTFHLYTLWFEAAGWTTYAAR